MPSVDIIDLSNKKVGTVDLADAVFAAPVNEALLYEAVRHYLAGTRRGTASTKTRHEVAGREALFALQPPAAIDRDVLMLRRQHVHAERHALIERRKNRRIAVDADQQRPPESVQSRGPAEWLSVRPRAPTASPPDR